MTKRRTATEIARDELAATVTKLQDLESRREVAMSKVVKMDTHIAELTALRDYQAAHPLLKEADTEAARTDQAYSAQITQGLTKKETD